MVGAGPGDPKLLTLRGRELLEQADVVVYDRLIGPGVLRHVRPGAELIHVGKHGGASAQQAAINRLLIREAKRGRQVVRLKGGDPFVFGRGGEEALALHRARVRCEIVPGVTSAVAAPAYAGIPVTHRQAASSVAFVTGHEDPGKRVSAIRWASLAAGCDTLVFLMGVATLPQIVRELVGHGRPARTPCAVIERGTWPTQRTITGTLGTIVARARRAHVHAPAVTVVGDVVRLRRSLAWLERRPLFGRRVLVTRAADKADAFAEQLEALGAAVECLPAIALAPVKANGALSQAVRQLPCTDWVFFTSPEGIGWFAKSLKRRGQDLRILAGCRIGAIGPKTAAAIEETGLQVDCIPKQFSQEGLLAALPRRVLAGKRGLILSAAESRDALARGLASRGMRVRRVPIYRTVMPAAMAHVVRALVAHPFDFVTVTSASCVDHLWAALARSGRSALFRRLRFASIGPVTSAAVRTRGGRVAIEANRATIEGLLEAMVRRRGRRAA